MQINRDCVAIAVAMLAFLAVFAVTMRLLYLESEPSPQVESTAVSEEDLGPVKNTESGRARMLSVLDLTRTPAQTQVALSLLLLVPVGLLITALASAVGIHTIGTFSPTLLALSQARSDWRKKGTEQP